MKPRISLSKNTHRSIWLIATVITVFVVLLGLFFLTDRTIDEKTQDSIETVSDINNSLNKLSRQDSATSTLDYTITTIDSSLVLINDTRLRGPNLFENIYHRDSAGNLKDLNAQIETNNNSTANSLLFFKERLHLLSKYLNYSAAEDFKFLGEDVANDETRINLAKQAIDDLVTNGNLPQEVIDQLNISLTAFETFSDDKNLTVLNDTVTSNQEEIVLIIDASLSKIVKDYNSFYNNLLYQ